MKTAIGFIVYKRLNTTKRVFDSIRSSKPPRLYLISDGPRGPEESIKCLEVRKFVEENINWNCELIKVYSDKNLGCAKRVQTGLDYIFEIEETAIILEDDTFPNPSFFRFCEELLERYKSDNRVSHISGCNLHSSAVNFEHSYCFSSIVNIWGWATWKRAWKNFEINMPSWKSENKDSLLKKWYISRRQRTEMKILFDLHCNRPDPWAWSYQWIYSIIKNNSYSIVPSVNLVSNLGIGPNATNTKSKVKVDIYPAEPEEISFPLRHPFVTRNIEFERRSYRASKPSFIRQIKNIIKSIF